MVCNDIAPDPAKSVTVAELVPEVELRGGAITPGVYDLASAARMGAARGWQGGSAVALGVAPDATGYVLNWSAITPDYFATMGIPIVAGRGITAADTEQSPLVVVISQGLARRAWPNGSPIGPSSGHASEIGHLAGARRRAA